MKFHEYLDIVYINTNLEIQQQFSLRKQALTRAIPDLINWIRSFFKLISYFELVIGFFVARITGKLPKRTEFPKPEAHPIHPEPTSPADLKPVT